MHIRRPVAVALSAALLLLSTSCGKKDDNAQESQPSASISSMPSETSSPSAGPSVSPSAMTSASASASPSASASGSAEGVTVHINLVDGKPDPRPDSAIEVAKGEQFTLIAKSDKAYEIHIHGYDKSLNLEPGVEQQISFTADEPGDWEVEVEETKFTLFQLRVQ